MSSIPAADARLDSLAKTRERIVQAARAIVAEEGWQGAQMALIAARAEVATGSVYRYFESKATLFARVLAAVSEREIEVLETIIGSGGSAERRLHEAIHSFVRRAMNARRLAYALIAEPCEPEIDAVRLQYRGAIAQQIARVVRAGIASGEFAEVDANVAASCVAGAFMEALVGPLAPEAKPDSKAAERIATAIAELCTRMLLKSRSVSREAGGRRHAD